MCRRRNYFKEVKKVLDRHGILFIADEVQSGFAPHRARCLPSNTTASNPTFWSRRKASLMAFPQRIYHAAGNRRAYKPGDHLSTFGGNPVSCAASLANIEFMEQQDLPARATETGNYAMAKLRDLQKTIR